MKRYGIAWITILGVCLAIGVAAAQQATVVLKNGARYAGTLVYHHDANFNLIINGQERAFPQSEIAVVEFIAEPPKADELRRLPASDAPSELERNMVVMRDGVVVYGKLYTITDGERITVDTREGQRRDYDIREIARIYMSASGARAAFASVLHAPTPVPGVDSGAEDVPPGSIAVEANRIWTDTGMIVQRGDRVSFLTTGRIHWGQSAEQTCGPDGDPTTRDRGFNYPVPQMNVGGLIGRVGNSKPFPIGSNARPIIVPAGRLYLGVNDDELSDNTGAFRVVITR